MIGLFTMIIALVAIAAFGKVISEAFGRFQQKQLPRDDSYYTPPREIHGECSVTQDFSNRSPAAQPQLPGKPSRQQRMAELKRQYVADEITVEQYEAELDKLMRGE